MADSTPALAAKPKAKPFQTVTGWTIFFMVLLRVAIGWHFAYEGAYKLVQPDWRATGYLTQSTGPLRPVFLKLVDDPDGLKRLTPESVKARIDQRLKVAIDFYQLDEDQQASLGQLAERKKAGDPSMPHDQRYVDAIFADPDFQRQLELYKRLLATIGDREEQLVTPPPDVTAGVDFNKERLSYDYGKKAQARAALLARAEAPLHELEGAINAQLTVDQLGLGPLPHEVSQTWFSDWGNMIGLTAVGVCLMLGLFTRLAALGGISLLALYYFAMPPWPGYPQSPMLEGHYLIVNKNLIEMFALFVIATSQVGRWAGLDAFIGVGRRRARAHAADEQAAPAPA